jgi:hypothetical protein
MDGLIWLEFNPRGDLTFLPKEKKPPHWVSQAEFNPRGDLTKGKNLPVVYVRLGKSGLPLSTPYIHEFPGKNMTCGAKAIESI